jgi:hypothetical protein
VDQWSLSVFLFRVFFFMDYVKITVLRLSP